MTDGAAPSWRLLARPGLIAVLVVPLLLAEARRAHADFCVIPSPVTAAEEADIVFSGTTRAGGRGSTRFDVTAVWKGPQLSTIRIRQTLRFATHFDAGESYLVYAYRSEHRGRAAWFTHFCTRTTRLEQAREDLEELAVIRQSTALSPSLGAVLVEASRGLYIGAGIAFVVIALRVAGALSAWFGERRSRP